MTDTQLGAEAMTFMTADLSLAAYLMTHGQPLRSVTPDGSRRTFGFPVQARELAMGYYQNGTVPARTFANALRDLKALIRET